MSTARTSSNAATKGNEPVRKGLCDRIYQWFLRLSARAAIYRELYKKEGSYTVADSLHEDVEAIKSANLPVVWILATPGSPISALVNRLALSYDLYHVNIGSMLQTEIMLEVNREDEVHHLLHRGITVPRAFIFEIIRKQMANVCRSKEYKGFIFTEYPATLSQANEFTSYIWKPDFVLFIKFSEKASREIIHLYLKFQVKASKALRKLQPDINFVSVEQAKKFKREIDLISQTLPERFKVISASLPMEELCREIMKWIERALVIHNITPPLMVPSPLLLEIPTNN